MAAAVLHVTGARPNFPKAGPVLGALSDRGVSQVLVHTGQHYDDAMSEVFFRELNLPRPDVNLGVGSGTHAVQTARLMTALEDVFTERRPELVLVYGDVNSTAAAALVAAKLGIPLAHVEAGLRSFDRTMPEEINRLVTDRLSDLLLVTSPDAIAHLAHEGVPESKIHFVGNPMIDTLLSSLDRLGDHRPAALEGVGGNYAAATLHRPANVDSEADARALVQAIHTVADRLPVVLPLHPRGRGRLEDAGLLQHPELHVLDPLGYLDFMRVVRGARLVVTDSGGVQEETTVLGVPCLTLRPNTERPVTITHGTNRLVTKESLAREVDDVLAAPRPSDWPVPPLWDGRAGARIAEVVQRYLDDQRAGGAQPGR